MDETGVDGFLFRGIDSCCDVSCLVTENHLLNAFSLYDSGSDCGIAGTGAAIFYRWYLCDTNDMDRNLLAVALRDVWSHTQEYEHCGRVSYDKDFFKNEGTIYQNGDGVSV